MALDAAAFLRGETLAIIAAIASTLTRVVSGVLWWRCAVHSSARRPGVYAYELEGLQKDVLLA
jgi:hypothetical protein